MKLSYYLLAAFALCSLTLSAQESLGPSEFGMIDSYRSVPSIAEQAANGTLILADQTPVEARPKLQHGNQVVPGKGLPKGDDPLRGTQLSAPQRGSQGVIDSWLADISQAIPSDPTGAAGPNHYVAAWNTAFRIFDKQGTPLTAELSLATLFGATIGDPIVFYDKAADRIVITQFAQNPNGFDVAVCQGSDPLNDGWHVYTLFNTGAFPDYTKFAAFGDVYMVTANIGSSNRAFAVERNQMLNGDPAQFVAFPLPNIRTFGFYSPHAFHTTDENLAPAGTPVPIAYMQDDAWAGVSEDHIKIWNATVDWADVGNSSISLDQELTVAPFVGVFDGGSFSNRPQGGGVNIDVLQATMMNQIQYRRFNGYNSVVMNFVVDVVGGSGEKAAVRWYELRQTADGDPWTIFQEGTFEAPDGKDAYSASMAMNGNGDIGMGFYTSSISDRIAMNYTGRYASDPLNVMTVTPTELRISTAPNPSNRLADYVHLTVDPADDETFYYIAETFENSRRNWVYHFSIGEAAGVGDNSISNSELNVLTKPGNKFEISLVTDFDGVASISVIDVQGRIVAFNNIDKDGDSYKYNLDMSYAASGVYIIQMGSQELDSFKTAKIIVK